ncbi:MULTISPECIES: hypothetical protein [unclassified Providencia]|uniref:hypothetical protein n=1 Tax=unclassified Providencia TaxID=2633465 RepID=UPI00234AD460|nr:MULTISPECIES: hypothetical protein [unclassified Providencia]
MRKYIPLIPALIIIFYSVIAFFDGSIGSHISAVIINTCISLYGFKLFFTFSPYLTNKDFEHEFKGIEKHLLPLNDAVYTATISLTIVAAFALLLSGQWFVMPMFVCLCFWQGEVRGIIMNTIKAESK